RHLKQVPGRKSDVRDCQWIAQLLQYGLLKGSFIPPRSQRELRDLTRHRTQLVEEKTRTANRIHKVLQDTNIKLSSVATDVLGVSGRAMLEALITGEEDPGEARPFGTAEAAEQDPRVGEGPGRTPDRASSVHAAVAVETTGPAGRVDRRVRPQNRGA